MTDNKELDKLKGLLDIARHSLEHTAYIHIGSRMFKNKDIGKTLTELEQAAIDFAYAKFKHDENQQVDFPVEIKTSTKSFTGQIKVNVEEEI